MAITQVKEALARQAVVALLGPRQVGKTTLALQIAAKRPSVYLDLESAADRARLAEPTLFLRDKEDQLIILDEIHRMPGLFQELRGIVDAGRRKGKRTGRFLVLGSAAIDLLRQSGETLAGRIEYVPLTPLQAMEVKDTTTARQKLWLRGGFPDSYLARSDADSFRFRRQFIRTYLERDIPQFGPRIPAETLERLWMMLSHSQGSLLNASKLASSLSLSVPTVTRYISLLCDLLLVRRLPAYHNNGGKRLTKSPKTYVRDTGLLHALLGIETRDALLGHPVLGMSWEGFVIENLLSVVPENTKASFYQSAAGAEIDLLLEMGGKRGTWAVEIKHGLAPKLSRGFYSACDDISPKRRFVVYSGEDSFPLAKGIEALSLRTLMEALAK